MHRTFRPLQIIGLAALLLALTLPSSAQTRYSALIQDKNGFSMLADTNPGSAHGMDEYESGVAVPLGNKVVFFASDPENGLEPWITDGSSEGTALLKDTNPGANGVHVSFDSVIPPVAWKGKVFFAGRGIGTEGLEVPQLWVSDGTADGTYAIDNNNRPISGFTAGNTGVMFVEKVGNEELSLWWTEGTPESTRLLYKWLGNGFSLYSIQRNNFVYVKDPDGKLIAIDLQSLQPTILETTGVDQIVGEANGLVFYSKTDTDSGCELWETNGTPSGTQLVANLSPGPRDTWFTPGLKYGDSLSLAIIVDTGGGYAYRVYITSGKASGVTLLASNKNTSFQKIAVVGDRFFFQQVDIHNSMYPSAIWRSDGTPSGTEPICSMCQHSRVSNLVEFDGKIFYSAVDGAGQELWMTDQTESGTHRWADLNPGAPSARPNNLLAMDGYLFFTANDGVHGTEPWVYKPIDPRLIANRDLVYLQRGVSKTINVLANDIHLDGKLIMLQGVDSNSSAGGTLARHDAGTPDDQTDDSLTYTPPLEYLSFDEFSYTIVDDGGNTATGRVTLIFYENSVPSLFLPLINR